MDDWQEQALLLHHIPYLMFRALSIQLLRNVYLIKSIIPQAV